MAKLDRFLGEASLCHQHNMNIGYMSLINV